MSWVDDDAGRTITDPTGQRHYFRASAQGWVEFDGSNGSRERSDYDRFGRCLAKVRTRREGGAAWRRSYAYSAEGDLLSVDDSERGEIRYEYDPAHRLVGELRSDGARVSFSYDAAANLVRQPGLEGVVVDKNRLVMSSRESLEYDSRDRLVVRRGVRGTSALGYDSCDRLVACSAPDGEWRSRYDPLGRRIAKTWQGETTEFYWDDARLAAERGADGSVRIYVYADQMALVPFMFVDYDSESGDPANGRRRFVVSDQIGRPVQIEDDLGRIVWQASLAPYGAATISPESTIQFALRSPGQYEDREIGLCYNRFRFYSPELGRYIQPDPAGLEGGLNLYAYPASPLVEIDVFGLHPPKTEDGEGGKKSGQDDEGAPKRTERDADPNEASPLTGEAVPGAVKVVEHTVDGQVVARYYVDEHGRTIRAEGLLSPPASYKKEGVSHVLPEGFVPGQDHRGHLIPERSAASQGSVNVPENVIAEHGRESNLSSKKSWENDARQHADNNPGTWSVHEPNYDGDNPRPSSVDHKLVDSDGNDVPGSQKSIDNPDYS